MPGVRLYQRVTRAVAGWSDPISRDLGRSGDQFVAR
jgi:hypothetical protein